MSETDPLRPEVSLLVKLGSLITHYQEFNSEQGHHFDRAVIDALESDKEVSVWLDRMHELSLLPVKR